MLWKKLKADDFDTEIIEVLRESNKKIREQLEGLSLSLIHILADNGFEHDVSYLKNCSYKKEASAVGAAKMCIRDRGKPDRQGLHHQRLGDG